jgi:hypothetical protein
VIRCTLRTVDLEKKPRYVAVSYSWLKDKSWARYATHGMKTIFSALSFVAYHTHKGRLNGESTEIVIDRMNSVGKYKRTKQLAAKNRERTKLLGDRSRTIILNRKKFHVLPNLYYALLQFRRTFPKDYWIDAICIKYNHGCL